MNAICLTIDRLHVGHLGAYGNAWIDTPAFDRLACESFVFDQTLVGCPRVEGVYRNIWRGRHPLLGPLATVAEVDLPGRLSAAGVKTALLTDDARLAESPLAGSFDELVEFDPAGSAATARDVGETHLARCFARAIEWLDSAQEPFLAWIHLASLGACWDAPRAFRERYVEPGDPPPPETAEVPSLVLPDDFDPDALLGIVQSYAGQITLFDVCLGALLESLDEGGMGGETLLALFSSRGFPLGEHRRVGACGKTLHGELVHVPMLLRLPDRLGAAARSQSLVTPADLRPTLLEWWSLDRDDPAGFDRSLLPIVRDEAEAIRDRLMVASPGEEAAIRTPAWYMRLGERPKLYVKPDDRWEVNDVADRCPEVVEELQAAAHDFIARLDAGRLDEMTPLSDVLQTGLG